MHINQNASLTRRARALQTGRVVEVREGFNANNGDRIAWVRVEGQPARRCTGKTIAAIYNEIDSAIASGEAIDLF